MQNTIVGGGGGVREKSRCRGKKNEKEGKVKGKNCTKNGVNALKTSLFCYKLKKKNPKAFVKSNLYV